MNNTLQKSTTGVQPPQKKQQITRAQSYTSLSQIIDLKRASFFEQLKNSAGSSKQINLQKTSEISQSQSISKWDSNGRRIKSQISIPERTLCKSEAHIQTPRRQVNHLERSLNYEKLFSFHNSEEDKQQQNTFQQGFQSLSPNSNINEIQQKQSSLNEQNLNQQNEIEFLNYDLFSKCQFIKKSIPSDQQLMNEDNIEESGNQYEKYTAYDLQKGLSLKVSTLNQHYQFNKQSDQVIPFMVSLCTLESTDEKAVKDIELQDRPNLDLICVIDNSCSMRSKKLDSVKVTLYKIIDMLGKDDRLSLITFNSSATQICHLRRINDGNTAMLRKVIDSIDVASGTNINSGLQMAFNVLSSRKQKNPVSSIFLLSDGQDKRSYQRVQDTLKANKKLNEESFTIHSFGYGNDHDGPLMQKMALLKNGNFYYIEKIDQVDKFFLDALAGLFSVVAQEIKLEIKLNTQNQLYQKFFSEATVTTTYGSMWKIQKQHEVYSIQINQLLSGVTKDFIFEMTFPKSECKELQDFERNIELIQVSLCAIPVHIQYTTAVQMDASLVLTLFAESEEVSQDSEINGNVEFNYLRVKAAQAIEEAMQYADSNQFIRSQEILSSALERIEKSHPSIRQRLEVIKEEIIQSQLNAQPQIFQQQGRFNLLQSSHNNYFQQSFGNRSNDIYQNSRQQNMVSIQSQLNEQPQTLQQQDRSNDIYQKIRQQNMASIQNQLNEQPQTFQQQGRSNDIYQKNRQQNLASKLEWASYLIKETKKLNFFG